MSYAWQGVGDSLCSSVSFPKRDYIVQFRGVTYRRNGALVNFVSFFSFFCFLSAPSILAVGQRILAMVCFTRALPTAVLFVFYLVFQRFKRHRPMEVKLLSLFCFFVLHMFR